ncbi:MAG: addiction module antitoxin RelB [Pseudomonadota bacterium]|nr:addiction module antitoxin RelB [Pseudomonadota bacterium]
MNSINHIIQEAAQLPEDQRFTLVNRILTLSEPLISDDIVCAWNLEIRDRIDRYDRGETCSRPAGEVFSELDRRLKL